MRPIIRRLLNRKQIGSWLNAFSSLEPDLILTLLEPDGRVFARSGGADEKDQLPPTGPALSGLADGVTTSQDYQAAPLNLGDSRVGFLAISGGNVVRARAILEVAVQALTLMLKEADESRGLAAEALDRYREINLLYRLGETIGLTLDPWDILDQILKECQQIIDADFGLILLNNPETGWQKSGDFGVQTLADQIKPLLAFATDDLPGTLNPAIMTEIPELGGLVSSLLWAPLTASSYLHGGVLLGRSAGRDVFLANDLKLLTALSSQAAIAMETARLHQAELAKQRMEKELQMGHALQSSLIPSAAPELAGWEFAVWWHPAREVSGDFCDFVWQEDALGVVIADVADKGVQAALFMALTRSAVRASLHAANKPGAGISKANQLISQDASQGMFVTLCYAQFRPASNEIIYVNAGHNPPLWLRPGQQDIVELEPTGTFLGYDLGLPFEQKTIRCSPNDIIVFYTDGITEAMDHNSVQFGEDRFQAELSRAAHLSPAMIQAHLQAAIQEFVGETPQSDDITLVIAKRTGERYL